MWNDSRLVFGIRHSDQGWRWRRLRCPIASVRSESTGHSISFHVSSYGKEDFRNAYKQTSKYNYNPGQSELSGTSVVARLPERRWMSTEGSDAFTEYISPVFTLSRDRELFDLTLRRGEGFSGGGVIQKLNSCHKRTKGRRPGDTYLSLDKLVQVLDRFRLNDDTVCTGHDTSKKVSRTLSSTVFISWMATSVF